MKMIAHSFRILAIFGLCVHASAQNIPFKPLPTIHPQTNDLIAYGMDISLLPAMPGGDSVEQPLSPATSTNFQGLLDNDTYFPPDTYGAVGTNHVVTMLNTEVRVQTRTGTGLQTNSLPTFWSSTNTSFSDVFDPRLLYDPFNHRWIACALTDENTINSSPQPSQRI